MLCTCGCSVRHHVTKNEICLFSNQLPENAHRPRVCDCEGFRKPGTPTSPYSHNAGTRFKPGNTAAGRNRQEAR